MKPKAIHIKSQASTIQFSFRNVGGSVRTRGETSEQMGLWQDGDVWIDCKHGVQYKIKYINNINNLNSEMYVYSYRVSKIYAYLNKQI